MSEISVAVVIPNWNGRRWLPGCLESVARQTLRPAETIVVDDGSTDRSLELLREAFGWVAAIALGRNSGFAHAANAGVAAAGCELVALVNTDVRLAPDWLERMAKALLADPGAASAACKMADMDEPARLYDTGDFLRRDGVCEQRGRFELDDGSYDTPGEAFSPCAGAALYRRDAFLAVGGFDERYFAYLEDVDLGLRLRRAGWTCRYEPVVALHAGEGSSRALERPVRAWVERNTLLLVARHFPLRWAHLVAYRQLGWTWHALRERALVAHLRGAAAAAPLVPAMLRERRSDGARLQHATASVVPPRPIRGLRAGGYRRGLAAP